MPNVGGSKLSRRLLLSSVVTSVLTYGISIWADTLETQESWRKAGPVFRQSALRVASVFRTISEEAVYVISGTLLLRVLAEERRVLYHRKWSTKLSVEEFRTEEWQNSISQWQLPGCRKEGKMDIPSYTKDQRVAESESWRCQLLSYVYVVRTRLLPGVSPSLQAR